MSKIDAKMIDGLEDVVIKLFAPTINDGQSVSCYVGEEITPYTIQGDNVPNGGGS